MRYASRPALLAALLAAPACTGEGPSETPTPSAPARAEHCGVITDAQVWSLADSPHLVTCDVEIEQGGAVTIEAGATVAFEAQTRLYVGRSGGAGTLTVAGEEAAPVTFEGADEATWYGLSIAAAAGAVTLDHLRIEDGGDIPGGQPYLTAPLAVFGAQVLARSVTISRAGECGVLLAEGARLADGSTGISVSGGDAFAACVDPSAGASLPTEASLYAGNGTDGVLLLPDVALTAPVTLADLGVPWVIPTDLHLTGAVGQPAVLTLGAGVEVAFYGSAGLFVGEPGGESAGGLITQGTADAPVLLRGWNGTGRGAWDGVTVYEGTVAADLALRHTSLEGGGNQSFTGAALAVAGTGPLVDEVTISGSRYAGFKLTEGARFQDGSRALSVQDCAEPGHVETIAADSVPEDGAALTGNDADVLVVTTTGGVGALTQSATWGDVGIPYRIVDRVEIDGTAQAPAILTLEAGVDLMLDGDRYLLIGQDGAAGLIAVGTEDAPVTLTSSSSLAAGAWRAVYFATNTVDASASLTHVEVGYAGGDGFYRRQGAIIVEDASPTLSHVWIHDSECNGVAIYGETSAPVLTDMRYDAVACEEVYDEP